MDYIFKPLGLLLGVIAVIFCFTFMAIGIAVSVVVALLVEGYRFGAMKMEIMFTPAKGDSPWSKVLGVTNASEK